MNTLLYRTVKNQPWNENLIRGIETDIEKVMEGTRVYQEVAIC